MNVVINILAMIGGIALGLALCALWIGYQTNDAWREDDEDY